MHVFVTLSTPALHRLCPWPAPLIRACLAPVVTLSRERGSYLMIFKVGDTVVYPHHGAALIEAIETRTIKGEQKEYLVLKVAQGDLTVRVPAENAEYVGVRDVVGQEGLDKVFQVLRAPHTEEPTNWSRRDKERGLSAGEKRMLAKARQILVGELALAENTDDAKAATILDEVLAAAS